MRISGFTMVRNATKLYYPIAESIASILPIVDEYVVALGNCDPDDNTQTAIEALNSDKIRIIHTVWDTEAYPNGTENAHQTDIALRACTGDWCFYLQADEVVHEKDWEPITRQCRRHLDNPNVEGLLFDYYHFWGDYQHYHRCHGWYPHEIRIVRNHPDIHSWGDAQSFRRIPNFDGRDYRQSANTFKLGVAPAHAHIYHYGWVRPPQLIQKKRIALGSLYHGNTEATAIVNRDPDPDAFDFGPLDRTTRFEGTHPAVMEARIAQLDWAHQLQPSGPPNPNRKLHRHETRKNRLHTWVENRLLGGRQLGGFKNYRLVAD